jgi:hypothetical protein
METTQKSTEQELAEIKDELKKIKALMLAAVNTLLDGSRAAKFNEQYDHAKDLDI